jgi:predicted enzyme related to lactoylglutathione lyase
MPGKLVHFEVPASDTSRALDFYKNMFGWKFQNFEGPV